MNPLSIAIILASMGIFLSGLARFIEVFRPR